MTGSRRVVYHAVIRLSLKDKSSVDILFDAFVRGGPTRSPCIVVASAYTCLDFALLTVLLLTPPLKHERPPEIRATKDAAAGVIDEFTTELTLGSAFYSAGRHCVHNAHYATLKGR